MAQKKISKESEAYASRGKKAGKSEQLGVPQSHEMPKPKELKKEKPKK